MEGKNFDNFDDEKLSISSEADFLLKNIMNESLGNTLDKLDVNKYAKKILKILPDHEQAVEYFKLKNQKFQEPLSELDIRKWLVGLSDSIDYVKELNPNFGKYIDYDELVAVAYQESLLCSDEMRKSMKWWVENKDKWYLQIAPINEKLAIWLLPSSFDLDLKNTDPQKYRTSLAIVWFLNNKVKQPVIAWWTKGQLNRLSYYEHNLGHWQMMCVLDHAKKSVLAKWSDVIIFSDVEQSMLYFTWQKDIVHGDFTKRVWSSISLYYQNLLKYTSGNIVSIPVLSRPSDGDSIMEWSKQNTKRSTIWYNYLMYVDTMVRYLKSNN